jgi:hypothetical protein
MLKVKKSSFKLSTLTRLDLDNQLIWITVSNKYYLLDSPSSFVSFLKIDMTQFQISVRTKAQAELKKYFRV